ncbi:polyphosphate polymerase domain-containing protein [Sinanaerobacter chloroacetimidivorans]|jgi:SPX domain protein involved in polyphosphate accumulation|uniref:Polyphosphate polymerase domain-containing protein n=1 Tax=Sinanaerobacter chloroacetimidivorans TaxID=2818044 RepID=A0A8J7W053_9FIRM|nr:polyphosphate polymerase domain-containing protein [Sinanaerobacter chloroacetimidivorans]MBR0598362.1 polyphosphate polymerase domain-containing protein [Sinanaerobacter chloroacetimidivorans]
MKQYQDNFQRYEKKYMLSKEQHQDFMTQLKGAVTKDDYGLHTIGNIYFDTENYDLIRTSIEKPIYKEKLRLRSYGVPKREDKVFVEIKKKFKGVVYKRRAALSLGAAHRYLLLGEKPEKSNQILQEIDWFMKMYQPDPKVFIAYDRTAFFGNDDPNLRITFDENIRFRESCLDLSKGNWGEPLLNSGKTLMEIKIPGVMPLWLSHILADLEIFPTSYSKYGTCYKEHLFRQMLAKGGMNCA